MFTGLLHTHKLVAILFVVIYLVKTVLLLSNKEQKLAKFIKVTKVPEMIISFLFLATGVALLVLLPEVAMMMWYKLILVFLAIPLAVIGFKRRNKVLALLSFVFIIGAYGLAEMSGKAVKKEVATDVVTDPNAEGYGQVVHGEALFKANCSQCHGMDGKLMMAGAKDMSISTISSEEIKEVIRNGKNAMPKYKDALAPEEIDAVTAYVLTLRKSE